MVIMPRGPTMTQARDAMLAADMARFGGANQDLIWQGFAMRGFGQQHEHGQQRRRESGPGLLVADWRTTRR